MTRTHITITIAILGSFVTPVWAGRNTGTGADIASARDQASLREKDSNLRETKAALATAYAELQADPDNVDLQDAYSAAVNALPAAAANDGMIIRPAALKKMLPVTAQDLAAGTAQAAGVIPEAATPATPAAPGVIPQAAASGQSIAVTQHPQVTGYYCGPASGQTIAEHWRSKSAADGKKPTQELFATTGYMKTNANGATTWASNAYSKALNSYIGYNFHVAKGSPSSDYLWHAVKTDIGNGHPLAMDAVYFKGANLVLRGHPNNKTRGHWIVIKGWSGSNSVTYVDPAHNSPAISWGKSVPAETAYSLSNMTQLASSNGIVW